MNEVQSIRKPLAFEQQDKESSKAFAAFSLYLSLGPQRSLATVGRKLDKSDVLIQRWSRRWDWEPGGWAKLRARGRRNWLHSAALLPRRPNQPGQRRQLYGAPGPARGLERRGRNVRQVQSRSVQVRDREHDSAVQGG